MNESGATAFECRAIAKRVELDGARLPVRYDDKTGRVLFGDAGNVERAILVEALTLLAEKKEAERGPTGDPQ